MFVKCTLCTQSLKPKAFQKKKKEKKKKKKTLRTHTHFEIGSKLMPDQYFAHTHLKAYLSDS